MKYTTLKTLQDNGLNVPFMIEAAVNGSLIESASAQLEELSSDKLYAVRSNCCIEDSERKSHAGEFETLLNVKKSDLEEAVHKVKNSYGDLYGTVIIQEMIDADISGVIFTANPIGVLSSMVIVYGKGLGSNIVEDKINCNTVYYNRSDKVYYENKKDPEISLGVSLLEELVSTALNIEKLLDAGPCDIEYAIKDGKIYILQSRHITTLDMSKKKIILDNSNIVESYPGVSLPLTQSFVREMYAGIFKSLVLRLTEDAELVKRMKGTFNHMLGFYNGRIYYDITSWYTILALLPFSHKLTGIWQEMLGIEDKEISKTKLQVNVGTKCKIIRNFTKLLKTTPKEMADLNAYFIDRYKYYREQINARRTSESLIELYIEIKKELLPKWDITLANDMYSFIYVYLSRKLKKNNLSDIKDLESKKPLKRLKEIAKHEPGSKEYKLLKQRFISTYGDRCTEELKLETKTYRTNPKLLDKVIDSLRAAEDTSEEPEGLLQLSQIEIKAIQGIKNREKSRMNRSRLFGITRDIMLKIGSIYHAEGLLDSERDIFYLTIKEIRAKQNYGELITQRKAEYNSYKGIHTENRVVFLGKIINKPIEITDEIINTNGNLLYGEVTSTGKADAEVVVINNAEDLGSADLQGKIIAAASTDPGWVYALRQCSGIIVEKGSLLSHTAIISRELKKPAIVGVKNATSILNTGDKVTLDAYRGIITIHNKE